MRAMVATTERHTFETRQDRHLKRSSMNIGGIQCTCRNGSPYKRITSMMNRSFSHPWGKFRVFSVTLSVLIIFNFNSNTIRLFKVSKQTNSQVPQFRDSKQLFNIHKRIWPTLQPTKSAIGLRQRFVVPGLFCTSKMQQY